LKSAISPRCLDLSDGGLFALRLDEVVPPAVPPLAEIEEEVAAAWRVTALRDALTARADQLVGQIATGRNARGPRRPSHETRIRRQDFIPDMPPTLVVQAFQLGAPGDVVAIPGARSAHIVRLDGINPAARDAPDTGLLLQILQQTVAQSMAQDIFESYGRALQSDAGIRLDQSVINAVHAQFP
jgi:peptidyl-prolyl cis-trans isomerase D